jgi:two-component system cell cycle response regulator DivK
MTDTPTILYIEDNDANRMLVRRILRVEGYRLLEAENASKAMEVLKTEKPNLILMDINLPEVDGLTLTARFRQIPDLDDVPIIAITANVMRGDRERTLEAGCDGYIQKPVDVDLLPEQIKKFLKGESYA